ncbi:MAG: TAXI family TRAP transporter solute-binding subunit [Synergistaceae bacterium]|nr:TAXI family TRAP transporter solute-binding subunit [Synergistota bacterium]NLM70451.1 TAXI family TRAP transporter solute-binding subunit [Synergistaceae bacterium]
MRKKSIVVLCALLLASAFAGAAFASTQFITIVTGSTGGTYYPIGTILANHFNAELMDKGYKFSAQSSGGTVENLDMMLRGEAEMAIAMANLTGFAYTGTVQYEGKEKNENLRYIMGLWPDVTQFIVSGASGIESWADLRGKKIAVGPAASGTEFSSRVLLKSLAGLDFDDIKPEYVGYSEAAQALQNGQLDGFNAEAGFPVGAVAELYAGRQKINMMEFSSEDLEKLKVDAPFYAGVVIPAGIYPGQDEDLRVAGIKSALIVNEDVPEDLVYEMLRIIYSKKDELLNEHAGFKMVDFDNPVDGLFAAPLHPGAVKFFTEIGMAIPEDRLP